MTIPNALTCLRIGVAIASAGCFVAGRFETVAVYALIAAALLDIVDGHLARRYAQCSALGAHLDPLADKLLMAVVYGVIAWQMHSRLIWVLTGFIALRELTMTLWRAWSRHRYHRYIPASVAGKVKMAVQSTVGLVLLGLGYVTPIGFTIPEEWVAGLFGFIMAVSWASTVPYLKRWKHAAPSGPARPDDGHEPRERLVGNLR